MAKEREGREIEDCIEATILDDLKPRREGIAAVSGMHARDQIVSNLFKDGAALEVEHCAPEAILAILDAIIEMSLRNIL